MRSGAPKLLIGGNDSVGHICWQRRDEHVGAYPILRCVSRRQLMHYEVPFVTVQACRTCSYVRHRSAVIPYRPLSPQQKQYSPCCCSTQYQVYNV